MERKPTSNPENIIYLDIETMYLITDFHGGWKNSENYKNVKIAELGILHNGEYKTFEEENINELTNELFDSEIEKKVEYLNMNTRSTEEVMANERYM